MDFRIPEFKSKKELFKFLVDEENTIIAHKKAELKKADAFGTAVIPIRKELTLKNEGSLVDVDELRVKAVINTTNVIDSHKDMHIPGLWTKSLKENKNILHLKEHNRSFEDIISRGDDLKAYVETVSWKSLGFDLDGKTEALTFDSVVKRDVNEYMHGLYAKGQVTQHSVGMQYVKMVTCIDDEDYPVQKENFDKYIEEAANAEVGKALGYFWAVLEAKCIEGSAVPLGSNSFTPTTSVSSKGVDAEDKALLEWLKGSR